jgi:hypothetical protein
MAVLVATDFFTAEVWTGVALSQRHRVKQNQHITAQYA